MARIKPKLDKFTSGLNNTIPSITENLPPTQRKNVINSAIDSVKGEICNKIDGAMNLVSKISSGVVDISKSIPSFNKDNISNFFEGPFTELTGRINDVSKSFGDIQKNFSDQQKVFNVDFNNQISDLEEQNLKRFESNKISKKGFEKPYSGISNLTNKNIRDINVDPSKFKNVSSGFCSEAETDLVDNALGQVSIGKLTQQQENLLDNFNTNSIDGVLKQRNSLLDGLKNRTF